MEWNQSTGCCLDKCTFCSVKRLTILHVSFCDKELKQGRIVRSRTDASGPAGWARRLKSVGQLSFRPYIHNAASDF